MKRILLQLDADAQPSAFDRIVAFDAGADEVLAYGGVTPESAVALTHGAIFTRGPQDLKHTAIFVGGSDAAQAEAIADAVRGAFFGPLRVSLLCDPNGANTTAAAAVLSARSGEGFDGPAAVLGLGPVGGRVASLLKERGVSVRTFDPDESRHGTAPSVEDAIDGAAAVFACGPAGVEIASVAAVAAAGVRVAVDLNAVPPAGLTGVDAQDRAQDREGVRCYGALAVGGLKMKIHRAAVAALFEGNDRVFGAAEALAIGERLSRAK
ncbi:methylene-tetrahydromethanopterin dehydrogenase N-terminal domain-containing protein [Alienimonas californiensis]|uniref:Bifunctional protein MdtA n=1 Tax=Alienimonas californiensis TaxID=2527989 RepID=A0A517PD51_9PLAN|nr:methylene-tetrahydromethanopterin dehydrogenase N-terminal domain-containing protein [Alienimonas californiensis]QDT17305.1 Bifunctional protein MdtA [Alienimonas californiensis]